MAYVPYTQANSHMDPDKWRAAPEDFTYPWGEHWHGEGRASMAWVRNRPRHGGGYKTRRMSAFDRRMLNRITSNRKPTLDELGIHPDQPVLS